MTVQALGSLKGRYNKLVGDRAPYLTRAQDAASLTIPALMPPSGTSGSSSFKTPYQGLGARAVNSLAAKLLLALMPANMPFYRLGMDEMTLKEISQGDSGQAQLVETAMAQMERTVQSSIEASPLRSKIAETLKHLIIAGNVCVSLLDYRKPRVFRLNSYVVRRDGSGNLLEAYLVEYINPLALPLATRMACGVEEPTTETKDVELYTGIRWNGEQFEISQEINEKVVPESEGSYTKDNLPFLFLRLYTMDGESYGRGYVEEYIGDLQATEGLSKANLQAAAAAARVLFLVKPGGTVIPSQASKAPNGAFIPGNRDDIQTLQLDKFADMQVTQTAADKIEQRLAAAFLMNSSFQRNGERVTAEEIRLMSQELETGLGGIYSMLSQELQLPLVSLIMAQMTKEKVLPALPKGVLKVGITTGVEALGRGQDADRLRIFVQDLAQLGPQAMGTLRMDTLTARLAAARGINVDGLVKTPQEIAAEQQQAMAQQALSSVGEQVGPDIARQALGMNQQQ